MITLTSGEQVVLEVRKHWYVLAVELATLSGALLVPLMLYPLLGSITTAGPSLLPVYLFYSSVWVLAVWVMFFVAWTNYYLDVLIVTNYRIIDVEHHSLFNYDMSEVQLPKIQDVKVTVSGFLPALLKFGTLQIQTAGAGQEFKVKNIPDPHRVKDVIAKHQSMG